MIQKSHLFLTVSLSLSCFGWLAAYHRTQPREGLSTDTDRIIWSDCCYNGQTTLYHKNITIIVIQNSLQSQILPVFNILTDRFRCRVERIEV